MYEMTFFIQDYSNKILSRLALTLKTNTDIWHKAEYICKNGTKILGSDMKKEG